MALQLYLWLNLVRDDRLGYAHVGGLTVLRAGVSRPDLVTLPLYELAVLGTAHGAVAQDALSLDSEDFLNLW